MRGILLGTLATVVVGCRGDTKSTTSQPAASAAGVTPAPTGPVVEVRMTGNRTSKAQFEPRVLTIAPGTTVRFINVSGGPHNVAFWPDSVPSGAAAALKNGMPNQVTDLTGPFLTQPNDHYDISFAGAPPGVYRGSCQPHVLLGMTLAITVK